MLFVSDGSLHITLALAQVLATKYINFQYSMLQEIKVKYFSESLKLLWLIGEEVYLLRR
jgi:hypothetical protein